jgi:PleD family two-component response regulator
MNENKISQPREPGGAPVQCGLRKTDASSGQIAPPNCLSVVTIECLERFVAGKSSATPGIQKIMPGEQRSCNGGRPNSRCRILVVDDEPDIRRINAMVLHRAGYHVDTAEDGVFAWEALGASRYDLMIWMPWMARLRQSMVKPI